MSPHDRRYRADFQTALVSLVEQLERSRELIGEVAETLAYANDTLARSRFHGVPAGRRRIMLVEDHDASAAHRRALGGFGYLVEAAHATDDARALARFFTPHVALVDLNEPAIDAWTLAAQLREDGHGVHLIAMAATADERDRARAHGYVEHLRKPVDVPVLVRMVDGLAA